MLVKVLQTKPLKNNSRQAPGKHKAQGMVEFALMLPIFLLLIFGVIEFGRLMLTYVSVTTASREAARYGSAAGQVQVGLPRYMDCAGMRSAAQRVTVLTTISDADIILQYDHGPSTSPFSNCPPASEDAIEGGVDRIYVQVSADYQPVVPLVNIPPFTISAESGRTIIKNIQVGGSTIVPSTPYAPLATNTPLAATATNTTVATATNTASPTATSANTATATSPPTATSTDAPSPSAPRNLDANSDKGSGNSCINIEIDWDRNSNWSSYPGEDPVHYQVSYQIEDGGSGSITTTSRSWDLSGVTVSNNKEITFSVFAVFSGGLGSEILSETYKCDKGNLED